MNIKKLLAIILCAAMLFALAACANEPEPEPEPEPIVVAGRVVAEFKTGETGETKSEDGTSVTYDFTNGSAYTQNVRFLGRTATVDYDLISSEDQIKGLTCFYWTDSGFEIVFKGTEISAEIVSNRFDQEPIYLYAAIDGKDAPDECNYIKVIGDEVGTYTLASGLSDGEHIVTVRRSTRACMSNFGDERGLAGISALKSVTVKGAEPTLMGQVSGRALKLEILGDSITCGDSIFMSQDKDGNEVKVEDGYRTYAAYCARELSADYNVMCISGNGFICSLFGTPLLDIPDRYPYICDLAPIGHEEWDFSEYTADVVVVNLGTNDISGLNKGYYTRDEMKYGVTKSVNGGAEEHHTGVFDVLDMLRENNPGCKIVWLCGAMGVRLSDLISEAIDEWNEQRGYKDAPVAFFMPLPDDGTVENGKAYDNSHPSESYGKTYGKELAKFIQDNCLKAAEPAQEETAAE